MSCIEDNFTVYPVYLNSEVSLSGGRKYSLSMCIPSPTYKEIKQALLLLNAKFVEEPEKMHPRDPNEKGRFKVGRDISRTQLIRDISERIKDLRKQAEARSKGSGNFLNLVPKSKKKSKKNK